MTLQLGTIDFMQSFSSVIINDVLYINYDKIEIPQIKSLLWYKNVLALITIDKHLPYILFHHNVPGTS